MDITQISTTACQTTYKVGDHTLHLWIITGGQPAISFDDYSFSQRYPIIDKRWMADSPWKGHYPHQDPTHIQGPTFDVLPEGQKSIEKYLNEHLPLKKLRMERFAALPISGELKSKKKLDKPEHTKVQFCADLRLHRFGPVSASSRVYSTHKQSKFDQYANHWWKKYAAFINPIFNTGIWHYEQLSTIQFNDLVQILKEFNPALDSDI